MMSKDFFENLEDFISNTINVSYHQATNDTPELKNEEQVNDKVEKKPISKYTLKTLKNMKEDEIMQMKGNGNSFRKYLDLKVMLPEFTPTNTIVILNQLNNNDYLKDLSGKELLLFDFQKWNSMGYRIAKNSQGIGTFPQKRDKTKKENVQEYKKEVKYYFDKTQVKEFKDKQVSIDDLMNERKPKKLNMMTLITILSLCYKTKLVTNEMSTTQNQIKYSPEKKIIEVSKLNLEDKDVLYHILRELIHAVYDKVSNNYERKKVHLEVCIITYMIAKKYGFTITDDRFFNHIKPSFEHISPEEFLNVLYDYDKTFNIITKSFDRLYEKNFEYVNDMLKKAQMCSTNNKVKKINIENY